MFLMNLLTSFVAMAVVGHKSVLNFSSNDKVAKFGKRISYLLNKQKRSAGNMGICTRKKNLVSGGEGVDTIHCPYTRPPENAYQQVPSIFRLYQQDLSSCK